MLAQLLIDGYHLKLGSFACPEQYDVFDQAGTQVAYFRLRHGKFTAECPDVGGALVYVNSSLSGDGIFDRTERLPVLRNAMTAVQNWIITQQHLPATQDFS